MLHLFVHCTCCQLSYKCYQYAYPTFILCNKFNEIAFILKNLVLAKHHISFNVANFSYFSRLSRRLLKIINIRRRRKGKVKTKVKLRLKGSRKGKEIAVSMQFLRVFRTLRIELFKCVIIIICLYYTGVLVQNFQLYLINIINENENGVALNKMLYVSDNSIRNNTISIQNVINNDSNKNLNYVFLISGGYLPIEPNITKYMVSIRTQKATQFFGDNHFCNGVMVSYLIVLTTAHCFMDRFGVATRTHQIVVVADCPVRLRKVDACIEYAVDRIIPHAQFVRHHGNDIALILLKEHEKTTKRGMHILSLSRNPTEMSQECRTLGWGQLFWDGPFSNNAVYLNLVIQPPVKCRKNYTYDYPDLLCAGMPDYEVGVCRGDSGTALVCNGKLAGLASESSICSSFIPITYTDISYHYRWILQKAKTDYVRPLNIIIWTTFLIIVLVT